MSVQNPIIPIATNPVGIDAVVIDLQGLLNSNLSWLSDGLGRAYKMNKVRSNGAAQILPLVYLGTSKYTYFSAQPDNDKQGQNFILVGDGLHVNQQQGFYSILEYDISIIFSVNLKLINAPLLLTEDFTQNLIAQVRDVLLRQTLGKPYNIGQITETRLFGDVYSEFDILDDSPNTGKAMAEMAYFRFNFSTQIKETCPVPVLPTAPSPPLPSMSLWLKGDAGVNGGSASNGDPVSIWVDQSTKNYDFIQNNFVNQPTFLESGVNGQKGIVFTTPNLLANVGANFFIADEGVVFIVCKRTAPSLSGQFGRLMTLNANSYTTQNAKFMEFLATDAPSNLYNLNMAVNALDISFGALGTTAALLTAKKTNTNVESKRDGVLFNTKLGAQSLDQNNFHSIGSWFNTIFCLEGEIYEIIIYEQLISDSEILIVESYLKNKYAIT